jgi:hypothetical protein
VKRQCIEWKKILANQIYGEGLISRILKNLELNNSKTTQFINGQRIRMELSPWKIHK